jgi:hypothetical protein
MTSVIILAQGRQTRFKSLDYPKCLIEVGGEPLLDRTVRLISYGDELGITAHITAIAEPITRAIYDRNGDARLNLVDAWRSLDDPGYCILDGLAQTTDLWSKDGRTVILLGDVCYSRAAMKAIFSDGRDCVFFGSSDLTGSTGELYALAFNGATPTAPLSRLSWSEFLAGVIEDAPCRKIAHKIAQPGHLRNLLWGVGGEPPVGHLTVRSLPPHYVVIDDFTTDFDTDEDLKQIPELERVLAVEEARKLHADVCERIPYPNPKTTVH